VGVIGLVCGLAVAASEVPSPAVDVPEPSGDQLIFYYDATEGHASFLGVSNPANAEVMVEVAVYPGDLGTPIATQVVKIPAGGDQLFDPSASFGGMVAGHAGLIVVTPVGDDHMTPIVPPKPLAGVFTIADTASGSAFGESPMARMAVTGDNRASAGDEVDGNTVSYEKFTPKVLMVPSFFGVSTAGDQTTGTDQVIVVAFDDKYGTPFRIAAANSTPKLDVQICTHDAGPLAPLQIDLPAILSKSVADLAGGTAPTSSGNVFLTVEQPPDNVFGLFRQAVGSFAAGQRLPATDAVPSCTPTATPTPTPTPAPTPAPVCGDGAITANEECDPNAPPVHCGLKVGGADFGTSCTQDAACTAQCKLDLTVCACSCSFDQQCFKEIDCEAFVHGCGVLPHACFHELCATQPSEDLCTHKCKEQ
jgi:hypothetical protein